MTDDKAIEAALDALFGGIAWGAFQQDITRERMRAALAAADKVRAEGEFDFAWCDETTFEFARRAFAAGLAKGEADRAALVEALKPFRGFWSDDELRGLPDSHLFEMIWARDEESRLNEETSKPYPAITAGQLRRAALALVRKGE